MSETAWQSTDQRITAERAEAIRLLYRILGDRSEMSHLEPVHRLDPALAAVRAFLARTRR